MIESTTARAASALFAVACGYASWVWFAASVGQPVLGGEAAAVAAFAYLAMLRVLDAVPPTASRLPVPVFDVRDIAEPEPEELLLTQRHTPCPPAGDPLLLDDILAELGPDSRVVRLFDPAAMPTAGQLRSRIEDRLARNSLSNQPQDASQALHEALAELRRSLR